MKSSLGHQLSFQCTEASWRVGGWWRLIYIILLNQAWQCGLWAIWWWGHDFRVREIPDKGGGILTLYNTVYKRKAAEDGWGGFILIVIHLLFSVSASLNQDFWYLDLEFCLWLDKHILALSQIRLPPTLFGSLTQHSLHTDTSHPQLLCLALKGFP